MKGSFTFNKYMCIYIYVFACLFSLATNGQEGYYYLSDGKKTWKFVLNDSKNAKILAEKIKSNNPML